MVYPSTRRALWLMNMELAAALERWRRVLLGLQNSCTRYLQGRHGTSRSYLVLPPSLPALGHTNYFAPNYLTSTSSHLRSGVPRTRRALWLMSTLCTIELRCPLREVISSSKVQKIQKQEMKKRLRAITAVIVLRDKQEAGKPTLTSFAL